MRFIFRKYLWKILGIDYEQALKIHDYVFLKKDKYTQIGYNTYDNGALVWRWTDAPLTIGKFCSIANNVRFIIDEGFHTASSITNFPLINNLFKNDLILPNGVLKKDILSQVKQKAGITVGNDVWIGMGTYIMPGVTIGNGVTIGANSVVTKDVADYTIVAGSPAKTIKIKYNSAIIQKLNEIAWWNWDENLIKERVADFYLPINHFIEKYIN